MFPGPTSPLIDLNPNLNLAWELHKILIRDFLKLQKFSYLLCANWLGFLHFIIERQLAEKVFSFLFSKTNDELSHMLKKVNIFYSPIKNNPAQKFRTDYLRWILLQKVLQKFKKFCTRYLRSIFCDRFNEVQHQ